jgi:hypothetical protein
MSLDFTTALDCARTLARVDELASQLWRGYAAGAIADADAELVAAQIETARRRIRPVDIVRVRAPDVPRSRSSFPPRTRRCVSPDRLASRARRRRLAYSGPLPQALAAGFTPGQLATLRVVADEIRLRGFCALPLAAVAARAGVCCTLARSAIRLAAGDGLLVIQERRRPGCANLPNVLRVISSEWKLWIAKWGRPSIGCIFADPTKTVRKGRKEAARLRRNVSLKGIMKKGLSKKEGRSDGEGGALSGIKATL